MRIEVRVYSLGGAELLHGRVKNALAINQLHSRIREKLYIKRSREFMLLTTTGVVMDDQSVVKLWEFDAVKDNCLELQLVKKKHECSYCGSHRVNMPSCSKCRRIRYCHVDCQLKDWQKHKKECEGTLPEPKNE